MIIEVDKKYFIAIMATMLIIAGTFFVVSFGGDNPSVIGHSAGEIDLPDLCLSDGTGCQVPQHFQGGYYGYCTEKYSTNIHSFAPLTCADCINSVTFPAYLPSNYCACLAGYTLEQYHMSSISAAYTLRSYFCRKN
jgi:hypothetical protein